MRLTRLEVNGLLSFDHGDLSLRDGLTVIVGPNAAGKTNLVRLLSLAGLALEWVEERSSGARDGGAVGVAALVPAGHRRGGHAQQPAEVVVPVFGGARRADLGGLLVAGVAAGDRRAGVLGFGGDVAGPDRRVRGGAPRRGAVQGVGGLGAVPVVAGDQLVAGVVDVAGGARRGGAGALGGAGPVEREPVAGRPVRRWWP